MNTAIPSVQATIASSLGSFSFRREAFLFRPEDALELVSLRTCMLDTNLRRPMTAAPTAEMATSTNSNMETEPAFNRATDAGT